MPRGETSEVGDTRVAPNGYHYIRTEKEWRLRHHVIAEQIILKRPLAPNETVRFRDGDRDNLHPDNLLVATKGQRSLKAQLAKVLAQIKELEAKRDILLKELEVADQNS